MPNLIAQYIVDVRDGQTQTYPVYVQHVHREKKVS